jgi:hypothetical protein
VDVSVPPIVELMVIPHLSSTVVGPDSGWFIGLHCTSNFQETTYEEKRVRSRDLKGQYDLLCSSWYVGMVLVRSS